MEDELKQMIKYVKLAKRYREHTVAARKIGLALNRCEGTMEDLKYASLFLNMLVED